ncbi:tryptophan dimethylallyltransferase family protein [Amycolatopsis alkalitolerans]|uniref:Tryptophan dimethylallyltransferase n=1 Tax=Amycolatopsis alkalitolerans TaxID=2547244 RepID=A0A5C4LXA9_9PSEU|nr:tryptophan dimethylallyltransferase family protein [Amycolatopsis alkalitolerans]TNC24187.1 tryptophan dimethylallyltransferase [Amycolatopsis alkalitolerans]
MRPAESTLFNHARNQLHGLCELAGFEPGDENPAILLRELLGPAGARPLRERPSHASDVADDGTPVEFSVAFDDDGARAIRVLGEAGGEKPGHSTDVAAGKRFLAAMSKRFHIPTERFAAVAELFLPERPQGKFAVWFSLILRPRARPRLKAYFNPEVRGRGRAKELVVEGFRRLGLDDAYETAARHALVRGSRDRLSFFAVDLDDSPLSRVKLYVSHSGATAADAERAAAAVSGADPTQVRGFCDLLGGHAGPFSGRPLVSSYSFVEAEPTGPGTYSLYLPIRDYVPDDEVARGRVAAFLSARGLAPQLLDRAIDAVTRRPLRAGVGLLAHVSLRLGPFGSGTTVYLSSEAYRVAPPRRRADTVGTEVINSAMTS